VKNNYFVQNANVSIINGFSFPKDVFKSINIGIRDIDNEFLSTLVQNMFSFPVYFVLEHVIFEEITNVILRRNIPAHQFSSDGFIIKIDSIDLLEVLCECTVDLVLNGLSVYIFFGEGLSEEALVPTSNWNKPTEFQKLNFESVETFIDVQEVGLTIFTSNEKYNTPEKVTHYVSKDYLLDRENSDI